MTHGLNCTREPLTRLLPIRLLRLGLGPLRTNLSAPVPGPALAGGARQAPHSPARRRGVGGWGGWPLPSLPEQPKQAAPSPGSPQSLLWWSEEMRHGGGELEEQKQVGRPGRASPLLALVILTHRQSADLCWTWGPRCTQGPPLSTWGGLRPSGRHPVSNDHRPQERRWASAPLSLTPPSQRGTWPRGCFRGRMAKALPSRVWAKPETSVEVSRGWRGDVSLPFFPPH